MRGRSVLLACLAVLAIGSARAAPVQDGLTLDWVFSDEGKSAASVPRHAWIDSGLLILYDEHPRSSNARWRRSIRRPASAGPWSTP